MCYLSEGLSHLAGLLFVAYTATCQTVMFKVWSTALPGYELPTMNSSQLDLKPGVRPDA